MKELSQDKYLGEVEIQTSCKWHSWEEINTHVYKCIAHFISEEMLKRRGVVITKSY